MKFFKVIVALCVLVGAQNVVFGLGATRGGAIADNVVMLKNKAVERLDEYINTQAGDRTQDDIVGAETAFQALQVFKSKGGQLTATEAKLVSRVAGVLSDDKARLSGGQVGTTTVVTAAAGPKQTTTGRVGVKRGAVTGTRTAVVPKQATVVTTRTAAAPKPTTVATKGRVGVKRGAVAGPKQTTVATTVVETRVEAPVVTSQDTRKIATEKLHQTIQFWFGEGDLLNLFTFAKGVNVNKDKLMQAFQRVELFRKETLLSANDVLGLIVGAVRTNTESALRQDQQEALFAEISKLLNVPYVSVTMAVEKLGQAIEFWFGEGDLLNLFTGAKVNNAKLMQAFERVELFRKQASLSVEDVFNRIMNAVRSNQQSKLSIDQQKTLLAETARLFKVELEEEATVATPLITPEMDLSAFFLSNGSLNMPMVYKAFEKVQMYQKTYNVTKQQVLNMVANNILKNETITVSQRNVLVSKMNELIIGEAEEVGGVQQGVAQIEGPKKAEGQFNINGKFNIVTFAAGTFTGDLSGYFAGGDFNIGLLERSMEPVFAALSSLRTAKKLNDEAYLASTYLELTIRKNQSIMSYQTIILAKRMKDMITSFVQYQTGKLREAAANEEEEQGEEIANFFQ